MRLAALLVLLLCLPTALLAQYVGSDACTDCHIEAAEAWAGSHHAKAWTPATPDNIVADFDGTSFELDGMTARFHIAEDDRRMVDVTELDGQTTTYPVHSVVGIEPLQQYLLETEEGRLQSFDVVWDTEQDRWFHLYPDQFLPPDDGLHWSGPYKNWNGRCAACHATDYQANYDVGDRTYASTQTEIGVGCEACHGPGTAHLTWAETEDEPAPHAYGFPVDASDPEAMITQCAGCHSRREAYFDGTPPAGIAFDDAYNLSLLRPGLYHPDGQIEDEVYVYGSFLQSKMYAKGVACGDCHLPHEAALKAEGNGLCTQCHNPGGNADFPSLPLGEYDSPDHHRHPDGSAGAACRSCHMPEQVYMGNDLRADHSFRVPRPDLSQTTGAPDACTACHVGRTADWAAATLVDWFPDSTHRGAHYGQVFARAQGAPGAANGDLSLVARDGDLPGIVRATALWLLETSGAAVDMDPLNALLSDPDPLVRAAAAGAQRLTPAMENVPRLAELLDDPSRTVRIAAARAMLGAPIARLPRQMEQDRAAAMAEWQATMMTRLDFPETHLQLGGFALTSRNFDAASGAFREVVTLDPQRVEAWGIMARIAAAQGDRPGALAILTEAVAANPNDLNLAGMLSQMGGAPSLLPPQ